MNLFLILEEQSTEFSRRLRDAAERKGLQTLVLTSDEIARVLSLGFFVSNKRVKLDFSIHGSPFEEANLDGVYCGIDAFKPELWKNFSAEDSQYAAQETQALWLAILSSLGCKVMNPPALDTLAGTALSTPEIMHHARNLGFQIATVITVESGKIAAEFLENKASAFYTDLGEELMTETRLNQNDVVSTLQNEDHYRITEQAPGKPVHVTLVGKTFLACVINGAGSIVPVDLEQIPLSVKTKLRILQRRLNLNVGEYHFRVTREGVWIFSGASRLPAFSVLAFGNVLFEHIINLVSKKGGSCGNSGLRP